MSRAAVLIGVRRAGGLPELQAVGSGLKKMAAWARAQRMDQILILSDAANRPVKSGSVYTAIDSVLCRQTLDQLVVYFAGHGINNGHSEYWLLSEAPGNPNEAINVAGSAVLAERSGVPHVVLISDACRTAPESIDALSVSGAVMFRNQPPPPDGVAAVDQFYACLLGDPAYEIRDVNAASGVYRSLYTEVLFEALTGRYPALVKPAPGAAGEMGLVRPWPLKRGLGSLVVNRLVAAGLALELNQTPDARITSDPDDAWISRVTLHRSAGGVGDISADSRAGLRSGVPGWVCRGVWWFCVSRKGFGVARCDLRCDR